MGIKTQHRFDNDQNFFVNLYYCVKPLPETYPAYVYQLDGPKDEKEYWKVVRSSAEKLARKGIDTSHVPMGLRNLIKGDIVILPNLDSDVNNFKSLVEEVSGHKARFVEKMELRYPEHAIIFEKAWEYRFRALINDKGYFKIGKTHSYVNLSYLKSKDKKKLSYRASPTIVNRRPAVWLDVRYRIIEPLDIEEAKNASEVKPIEVRVLPNWKKALVIGMEDKTVGEYKEQDLRKYWRARGITVDPSSRILKVKFEKVDKVYLYPEICVYKEYKTSRNESSSLRISPDERIKLLNEFINKLNKIKFLDEEFTLNVYPATISFLNFRSEILAGSSEFTVLLKKGEQVHSTPLTKIKDSLLGGCEPYTGKINANYIVIAPPDTRGKMEKVMQIISANYSKFNLGILKPLIPNQSIKYLNNKNAEEYNRKSIEVRDEILKITKNTKNIIVFIIIPSTHEFRNTYYYDVKNLFFEKDIVIQEIEIETLDKILESNFTIVENLAPQLYLKLHRIDAAVWISKDPIDAHIYGKDSGKTVYACIDISRRLEYKSQVGVVSAVTDSYGRLLYTDNYPIGGEKLTEKVFYELILRLVRKSKSSFDILKSKEPHLKFNLERIVLYKDGEVDRDEEEMMRRVLEEGIPSSNLPPLKEQVRMNPQFPSRLSIDIVAVNKNPNRRVYLKADSSWKNPRRGTCIVENERGCLLIGVNINEKIGTARPLKLTKVVHYETHPHSREGSIIDLAGEYLKLSYLNWIMFSQISKFALPHKITQKIGEYLSALVNIPPDVIPW